MGVHKPAVVNRGEGSPEIYQTDTGATDSGSLTNAVDQ